MRCSRIKLDGEQCKKDAIKGGTVCRSHGGAAPQVRAKAAIRYELMQWVDGTPTDDPVELVLRLMTQARMRADQYAAEMDRMLVESPNLRDALVGDAQGEFGKVGEYIRGLVQLESLERDRAVNFAAKAIAAGVSERQVRIAERQGELMAYVLTRILDNAQLGLSADQKSLMPGLMRETLQLAAAGELKR